jgi:esterase/lipase superfamily enzyme
MARYGKPKKPFFLFLSDDDRALRLSSLIAGNKPRLGDYGKAQDIAEYGFVVVDLSNVESSDRLNHMKFADNPLLVKMLGDGLQRSEDLTANEREVTDRINGLAQGLGQTLTSAAEIVITTPISVLNVAVGGN